MAVAITELNEVLSYKNPEVVARFCADHGYSQEQGELVFLETKRWLWLCARHAADGRPGEELTMSTEMAVLDEMWHTFLLFTYDYAQFCERYFGRFVHHQPTPVSVKATITPEMRLKTLEQYYSYIYDQLGPEVLSRWCEELPEKFPSQV